ncbi:hypothetical protein [Phenylobacterium sp.]|uniref:hypothetical protein n=1 Tax=Phenylobacterium sp. TaxID=1871053 RepID=UPI0035AFEED4
MTDLSSQNPRALRRQPRGPEELELDDAVRSGVGFLAFKSGPDGLVVSFQPAGARAPQLVVRAAQAAMALHDALSIDDAAEASSAIRRAAVSARDALERQLDDVRTKVLRSPKVALREVYLAALADYVIERLRSSGRFSLDL